MLLALPVAAAALVAVGWSTGSMTVRHASANLGAGPGGVPTVVDVWHDSATGEFAFQLRGGGGDRCLLRRKTIDEVISGQLGVVTTYSDVMDAWRVITARYGLTAARTNALLASGETVTRPALMTVPKPDPNEYTVARDFGTNLTALRRVAGFSVPSPGPRLDGRRLAVVSLSRTRTAHLDSGPLGVIIYSSDPAKLGGGDTETLLNVAPPTSGVGQSYAAFFAKSRRDVGGAGIDARLTSDGDAILRYHGSYVLVRLGGQASDSRWRTVLRRIARS
jgi:hypothetical protein